MDIDPINKFSENTKFFVKSLEEFTNHKIYYFGSSTRIDYIQGCDIDMAMFSDNITSLMVHIIGFLNIGNDFKRIVHKHNNTIVNGHKLIYKKEDIDIELVIYDNKFKNIMLIFYEKISNFPFMLTISLLFLKYLTKFNLLNQTTYYKIKVFLMQQFNCLNKIVVLN